MNIIKMILNHNEILTSKGYANEFQQLIHKYLPYNRKYYINLYIPNIKNIDQNNTNEKPYLNTKLLSVQDILNSQPNQGATYNIFNKDETGITYTKIKNFPIWFIDNTSAQAQLTINETHIGYIQEFNIVAYRFPKTLCFNGIDTFVNSVIEFDNTNRFFTINSETKFSAVGSVFNTLYQCIANILKQEFKPEISKELEYNDKTHLIISPFISNLYNNFANILNDFYNQHKYNQDYILGAINNGYILFDLIFILKQLNYTPSQFSFYIDKKIESFVLFILNNNIPFNIPNSIINYITNLKSKFNNCSLTNNDLTENINLVVYIYKSNNNDFIYSFNPNLSNIFEFIGQININNFNINTIYPFKSVEYWLQYIILLYLLEG